tara:strand:+ start:595 stop:1071 length:477 start_codon:yes stop_codon:yes gene_type:complete
MSSATLADRLARPLQLHHAQRKTVDVNHHIRPLGVLALDRHFLGNGKVVLVHRIPIDQPHGLVLILALVFDLHAVTQQEIQRLIGIIKVLAAANRASDINLAQHAGDDGGAMALGGKPSGQKSALNMAVASAVVPITKVVISQTLLKKLHDAVLRFAL